MKVKVKLPGKGIATFAGSFAHFSGETDSVIPGLVWLDPVQRDGGRRVTAPGGKRMGIVILPGSTVVELADDPASAEKPKAAAKQTAA